MQCVLEVPLGAGFGGPIPRRMHWVPQVGCIWGGALVPRWFRWVWGCPGAGGGVTVPGRRRRARQRHGWASRRYSGILSAYGLALADVVHEAQAPCALRYEPAAFPRLDGRIAALEQECRDALRAQGFTG